MKLKIYIQGGAILSATINAETKENITTWFKGEGANVFTMDDNGTVRLVSRKLVSLIEFS